ncbi:hypothetical protein M8494_27180 [Serratia ureilytica]
MLMDAIEKRLAAADAHGRGLPSAISYPRPPKPPFRGLKGGGYSRILAAVYFLSPIDYLILTP